MADSDWVTIKLPKDLTAQIDHVVKQKNSPHLTRAEFVREAVRTYLAAPKKPRL